MTNLTTLPLDGPLFDVNGVKRLSYAMLNSCYQDILWDCTWERAFPRQRQERERDQWLHAREFWYRRVRDMRTAFDWLLADHPHVFSHREVCEELGLAYGSRLPGIRRMAYWQGYAVMAQAKVIEADYQRLTPLLG